MRLGLTEAGVTELMAVADHARGLSKLAAGLRLSPEIAESGAGAGRVVADVPEETVSERVGAVYADIRAWAKVHLGVDRVPALWRALAHHPVYMDAVWRRDRAIMGPGALTPLQKQAVGYAMATNCVAPYMIDYHAAALRAAGLDDHGFIEVLAVVDYFNNLNTLADGMDIESDIKPYQTYE
jgi:hypothetical protein